MIQILDVRGLPAPEPMERILDALSVLPPGGRLRVLHRREPFPLYDLLPAMGYGWHSSGEDGCFAILIWDTRWPPGPTELERDPPC